MQALRRAADRGIKVRIYLEGTKLAKLVSAALSTLRQWINHIGDSFEFGCKLPCVVRRKHRVRAVEIDMHQVIKT